MLNLLLEFDYPSFLIYINYLYLVGKESEESIMTICLGNKYIPGCSDFTINNREGEAFNVASSFYKVKMRSTKNSN